MKNKTTLHKILLIRFFFNLLPILSSFILLNQKAATVRQPFLFLFIYKIYYKN